MHAWGKPKLHVRQCAGMIEKMLKSQLLIIIDD